MHCRVARAGDLATIGDVNAATTSSGDPSGAHDHSGTTGGGCTPTAGAAAAGVSGGASGAASMPKSASFTALSTLDHAAVAASAAPGAILSAGGAAGPPPGVLVPMGAFSMGPVPMLGTHMGGGMVALAGGGMTRVQSTPSLHAYHAQAGAAPQPLGAHGLPGLGEAGAPHFGDSGGGGLRAPGQGGVAGFSGGGGGMASVKLEGTYWSAELPEVRR
jgi:hypothetical protein